MFKYIYFGELVNWKIIVIDVICISICFEYIIHWLKKIKTNFDSKLPLRITASLYDQVRTVLLMVALQCASPVVGSLLSCSVMIILLGNLAYLYQKDKTKQYAEEIKKIAKGLSIASIVVICISVFRIYDIFNVMMLE